MPKATALASSSCTSPKASTSTNGKEVAPAEVRYGTAALLASVISRPSHTRAPSTPSLIVNPTFNSPWRPRPRGPSLVGVAVQVRDGALHCRVVRV